ncbi:mannose-1-phosphate guanyltransferase [Pokkaliibacter plantistimulans]|uniref:mannose-1-phosphate guanylyltransferase n=1 Tax=Pokkaliibacter plantistimulans TaxID=1635171 RepID=A0ABX5LTM8_9GAMM|nr:mannose-1-phosphate guanylyltransferase/mannose-6-phosphate isomerase [Pokkaliibacter plantistimulans]PXF28868.1 mannose-1-phosphate guanyltransferase [Pokkaliibacter plantistimulans]
MIIPVVMAGGSGTRLWPLSRALHPKQFLALHEQETMLQATIKRSEPLSSCSPIVICNENHRFIVAEQLRQLGKQGAILLEPAGRNTAPAIAIAAIHAVKNQKDTDPLLLVLAADHVIQDEKAYTEAILSALPLANNDQLVTFGIVPTEPHTGYGYIKGGQATELNTGYKVDRFVEKPDAETAQAYLASGEYYWNSGMFLFKASVYLAELQRHRPDIYQACINACSVTTTDLDFIRLDNEAFMACPDDSIDYAVMERTDKAVVVPMNAGWSDVGSWSALWDIGNKDPQGNVVRGDVLTEACHNSFLFSEDKLIAAIGIEDIVVVDTPDAIMVAHKSQVQDVKKIVAKLQKLHRSEGTIHRKVYRPWGSYDSIDTGARFQVKRIVVKPSAKLSVQMHHHRAEHWIVVSGTAKVTINGHETLLTENQSIYIPLGAVHALENPGKIPLELIEVQSGSYLGEDDIVRFEDKYGRA